MKITKQRLKEIIKEEVEFMGAAIDDVPEPPEEEPTRDRAFDSPLGRYVTLMNARERLNQMTRDQLKDLSMSLDAPMFAALLHILGPKYASMDASDYEVEGEMELEEYRGGADAEQSRQRRQNYRGGPEAEQSRQRRQNYRGGATRSANPGPRDADDPSINPHDPRRK